MYLFPLRSNLIGEPTFVGSLLKPEECQALIDKYERQLELAPGGVQDGSVQTAIRKSDIGWITPDADNRWLFDRIRQCVNDINSDWYKYDLVGFEGIQFTKYSSTGGEHHYYASHTDLQATTLGTVRKLSFSIQLSPSQAYEGGDVRLYRSLSEWITIGRDPGSITFFPAYTIHEVLPVTRGIRYSLVGWAHGPAFV